MPNQPTSPTDGPSSGAVPEPTPEPAADATPDPRPGDGSGAWAGPRRDESLGHATGALGDALAGLLKVVLRRGRTEVERIAADGRVRLELRQLRRDRDVMYQKLGRETRTLVEAGEITHPGMRRGVERIREIDERIAAVEAEVRRVAGPPAAEELGEE